MDEENVETTDIRAKVPAEWFEESLLPKYPSALSRAEAVRMALRDAVEKPGNRLSQTVADDILNSLDKNGGEWESVQTIRINSEEDDLQQHQRVEETEE